MVIWGKCFPQSGVRHWTAFPREWLELGEGGLGWLSGKGSWALPREWAGPWGCQSSRSVWTPLADRAGWLGCLCRARRWAGTSLGFPSNSEYSRILWFYQFFCCRHAAQNHEVHEFKEWSWISGVWFPCPLHPNQRYHFCKITTEPAEWVRFCRHNPFSILKSTFRSGGVQMLCLEHGRDTKLICHLFDLFYPTEMSRLSLEEEWNNTGFIQTISHFCLSSLLIFFFNADCR